jgi:hypothetical protein
MTPNTRLAKIETTLPGLLPDVEAEQLVASFKFSELDGHRYIDRLPTAPERSKLQRRLQDIARTLRPIEGTMTDLDAAARALGTMFNSMPSMRNANATDTINAFLLHLKEFPLFALERACHDVASNKVKGLDPDFPPTSARIAEVAQNYTSQAAVEKLRYERVTGATKKNLLPPPVSEEDAEKMRGLLSGLAAQMQAKTDALLSEEQEARKRRTLEANQREIERAYAARGEEPKRFGTILISPQLEKLMHEKNGTTPRRNEGSFRDAG